MNLGHNGDISSVPVRMVTRASVGQGQGVGMQESIIPPVSAPTYCGCGPFLNSSWTLYKWYLTINSFVWSNLLSLLKPLN